MSKSGYDDAMDMKRRPEFIGTRWVFTWKSSTADGRTIRTTKARLVAQGCQGLNRNYRTDLPTASRIGLFLTLLAAAQTHWLLESYDARTAFLQSGQMARDLMLSLPKGDQAPPGCQTTEHRIVWADGAVYGTRDAGRQWYVYLRKTLLSHGFGKSVLEKGLYYFREGGRTIALLHTHVDDFLLARTTDVSKKLGNAMASLIEKTYLKRCDATNFTHCGKQLQVSDKVIFVHQRHAAEDIDDMVIKSGTDGRRIVESLLVRDELTGYDSV